MEKEGENKEAAIVKMNLNTLNSQTVILPPPKYGSNTSLEEAILRRKSRRSYKEEALTLEEVSQLLWAVQGIIGGGFKRAAPSAGATYPLEIFLVVGKVNELKEGVYHYNPEKHGLERKERGDLREEIARAAFGQSFIAQAPMSIILTAIYERTTQRYGKRGIKYVYLEAGHVAQNVYLECESLGLGTVAVGAFDDEKVKEVLGLEKEAPLYIMPIGRT